MLKGYSEYKDTNYDWLPQVPSHWEWIYLSQSCKEQNIKNSDKRENQVLSLSYGNIIRKKDINFGLVPKEYSGYQIVDKGNIILRLTDLQNDHTSLRTGLVKEKGIITSAYTCIKPYENSAYLQYLLHSYDTRKVFYGMGGGVRQSIGFKEIRNIDIPFPPVAEQDQIVRYLDWKISMINKYIIAKKKQTELLKEHILTYLQKSVELKNNKYLRLKNIVINEFDEIIREKDTVYTPIGVLNRGRGIFHKPSLLGCDLGDSTFHWIKNDVLVLSGQFAWEGAVALSGDSELGCIASHRYYTLRTKKEIVLNSYLWAYLISQDGEILLNKNSIGAAGRNRPLNINYLLRESIPVPPMKHQLILDKYIYEYLSFVKFAKQSEILLNEYRTRLISDVVTGRMDVQGEKVPEFAVENEDSPGIGRETEGDIDDE